MRFIAVTDSKTGADPDGPFQLLKLSIAVDAPLGPPGEISVDISALVDMIGPGATPFQSFDGRRGTNDLKNIIADTFDIPVANVELRFGTAI